MRKAETDRHTGIETDGQVETETEKGVRQTDGKEGNNRMRETRSVALKHTMRSIYADE